MTPAELVRALAVAGVRVVGTGGKPVLDGPAGSITEELTSEAQAHRWLFVWGLAGVESGHHWHACDVCTEVQLLRPRQRPRRCRLTNGCPGSMHRLPDLFSGSAGVGLGEMQASDAGGIASSRGARRHSGVTPTYEPTGESR